MTQECEKRENLSSHRKEDMIEVVVTCNFPIMIRSTLVFAVDLSLSILTCNTYNIEFLHKLVILKALV